jgi:hypothetical protein
MKDVTKAIGTAYFDVSLRLTHHQLDHIIRQELRAQLAEPSGTPESVLKAMAEVLEWYLPDDSCVDYRRFIQ